MALEGRTLVVRKSLVALIALLVLAVVPSAAAQTVTPNDEHFGLQWGQQQIHTPQAWSTSTGTGETIAIVDSGVDLDHPDLASKIVGGATFTGCPDDPNGCGNGDWSGADPDEHGTHVAGIAAAVTDNTEGVAGTAPDANLLAVKALDEGVGSFDEVAAGVRWSVDNGADVINLSLGALPGVQAFEITGLVSDLRDAIAYANANGVVVVAAAGNEFGSICASPSFNAGALCVVATDRFETKATYSNFALDEELDVVAAPGGAAFLACTEDIISTWPLDAEPAFCEQAENTPDYNFIAGTSMASPHAAGVAALLTAQGRSNEETVDVMKATARTPPLNTRGTYTPIYGFGIVDAEAAVAAP